MEKRKIVIVGATSVMAEHCARIWVQGQAVDLTLIGRERNRTERVAADLNVRSPQSDIKVVVADFLDPVAIQATADNIVASGPVDIVLIAHGFLPEQANCQDDLAACREALEVNGISPVLYAEAFAKHFGRASGKLALVSSVAGDRGRKSNYVYGAAKGLVTRYAQGLQHRFAGTGVKVVLVKPGPTDTPMTAHLKAGGTRLASVTGVAKGIVAAIERGQSVAYTPKRWGFIMWVVRHLPKSVFDRMSV